MGLRGLRTARIGLLGGLALLALTIGLGVVETMLDVPGAAEDEPAQTAWLSRGKPRPPEPQACDLHLAVGLVRPLEPGFPGPELVDARPPAIPSLALQVPRSPPPPR